LRDFSKLGANPMPTAIDLKSLELTQKHHSIFSDLAKVGSLRLPFPNSNKDEFSIFERVLRMISGSRFDE
jgi:hypothetical protein